MDFKIKKEVYLVRVQAHSVSKLILKSEENMTQTIIITVHE